MGVFGGGAAVGWLFDACRCRHGDTEGAQCDSKPSFAPSPCCCGCRHPLSLTHTLIHCCCFMQLADRSKPWQACRRRWAPSLSLCWSHGSKAKCTLRWVRACVLRGSGRLGHAKPAARHQLETHRLVQPIVCMCTAWLTHATASVTMSIRCHTCAPCARTDIAVCYLPSFPCPINSSSNHHAATNTNTHTGLPAVGAGCDAAQGGLVLPRERALRSQQDEEPQGAGGDGAHHRRQ